MCQISVVLEHEGQESEKIMDGVSKLEVTADGVLVSTLFEEPKLVAGARILKIDFLGGIATLSPK
ncbi:MAG: CooT family nickel-binding protein [Proteobacteria bacterium]|nr:CooT family nickel-binding protein [Pseudomonadota bacterium]MBU1714399.1 CooT family nickel-binding protein [Pseudomonadota bacterium]